MTATPQQLSRRRRRPSGEAPPLPRALHRGDWWFLAAAAIAIILSVLVLLTTRTGYWIDRVDNAVLDEVIELRSRGVVRVARWVQNIGGEGFIIILRLLTVVALLVFRRFRHLFVLIGCFLVVGSAAEALSYAFERPRPLGYRLLGDWDGFSYPSRPVAALVVTLAGACFTLAPRGRPRLIAGWLSAAAAAALSVSRLILGVDHPSDVICGAVLGGTVTVLAFRLITPDAVFPVVYRRGRSAHLEIGPERADAIRRAVRQQLGLEVRGIERVGLAGSAGSTPLLLDVSDGSKQQLFAKLYAATHLRSDRWYKLGRTILYGRLEDEQPFSTVRRLVQYEDYMLRVMRDGGVPSVEPHGIVEITPEREYLLVTEFLGGAVEIGAAPTDDDVIDDALRAMRALWYAGLAHRDIKPANVMVHQGRVVLIDIAFGEIRPSPWRQAVDLANMMLVLATCSDPERVYARALAIFTPNEIAEAFAATRGVTSPTELRGLLRRDGRDLVNRFRELAPPRRPIVIQRWSVRRIGLIFAAAVAGVVFLGLIVSGFGQGSG